MAHLPITLISLGDNSAVMLLILDIGAFAETILIFSFCIKNKFRHNTKQLWKAYALKKIHKISTKLLAPDASMVHILFSQNTSSAVRNSKVEASQICKKKKKTKSTKIIRSLFEEYNAYLSSDASSGVPCLQYIYT